MSNALIRAISIFAMTAFLMSCDSSELSSESGSETGNESENGTETDTGTAGNVLIPSISRDPLTSIPAVRFSGNYQTTASPERGDGGGVDGGDGDSGDLSFGSTDDVDDRLESSEGTADLIYPRPPNPIPTIEPGTLTAGDYDDNLNPHLYQSYASDYLQRRGQWIDVPRLDFNKSIRIRVKDQSDRPQADAKLEISSASGQPAATLFTAANGETTVFSNLDSLTDAFSLKVTTTNGATAEHDINLLQALKAGEIIVTVATDNHTQTDSTPVDLMFVMDTTGSMGDELSFLQTELSDIINAVPLQLSNINIGLVFYRDYGDNYVVRTHGFSNNVNAVQLNLNQEQARGGGDYPEAIDQALEAAMDAQWRTNSRKILFLIADAPPHGDRMRATWEAAAKARENNIHIIPVAASGVADDAEYIMRSVAALTNARYLFLTDDSGYGLPHDEPDIDCYVVTSLRSSMIRALNSLVTGKRIEPGDNDIVRKVGSYDNGVCETSQPTEPPASDVDHTVLLQRQIPANGTFTEKSTEVIDNQQRLEDTLRVYGETSIAVDFSTSQVLLVDMGQQNTGGFSVRIASITEYEDYVLATVEFSRPVGADCLVTQALTNPFLVASVSTTKNIRIEETSVSSCK